MGQLLFVEVQNGCSKLSAQVLKGGKYWRICTDATRKKKKKLTEEHDQSRCWVPVPQRSYADLHQLKCSPSLLPSPPSSKDQEPCIMQEHFSSCRMICTGPNSTDIQGRPLSKTKGWKWLQMSISSPISYSVSPSSCHYCAGTALITVPISTNCSRKSAMVWCQAQRDAPDTCSAGVGRTTERLQPHSVKPQWSVARGCALYSSGETLPSNHSATFADDNDMPKINRSAAEKFRTRQK